MSTSISHLTDALFLIPAPLVSHSGSASVAAHISNVEIEQSLQSLLLSLKPPLTHARINEAIQALQKYESCRTASETAGISSTRTYEEDSLRTAIVHRLMVGTYAVVLDTFLNEAISAETEAEWWADIERSTWGVWYYLLQTLPSRVINLLQKAVVALHTQNRSFTTSLLSMSSLRSLLSEKEPGHPNILAASLFPHLHLHSHMLPVFLPTFNSSKLFLRPPSRAPSTKDVTLAFRTIQNSLSALINSISIFFTLPFELTRQECMLQRKELQRIRDERAKVLGDMTNRRGQLVCALVSTSEREIEQIGFLEELTSIAFSVPYTETAPSVSYALSKLSTRAILQHTTQHREYLASQSLMRPSRLTRLWPRLVFLPPLALLLLREVYASKVSLASMAGEVWETMKGFWRGWLVEPSKDIFKTVRAGGEEGMIVRKESVDADLQSLERMALDLAREKLRYGPAQLDELSAKIRVGDLTPILQIYEEDIKSPMKSAISGTLLRSVFVQVQKAKVDLDQTLTGIDKLLKSQELTFAFVGVAPAFAIVYIASGYLRNLWFDGRGQGRHGGNKQRAAAWLAMRRIERLLISQPQTPGQNSVTDAPRMSPYADHMTHIPPLTSGLMLISLSALRTYAETYLPMRSRLREGFLEDVGDLEDPILNREEKVRVIQRMWRSWGRILDWDRMGGKRER